MTDGNGGPSTKTDGNQIAGNGGLSTNGVLCTTIDADQENTHTKITTEEATTTYSQLQEELKEINEKIHGKGKIKGCLNVTEMMAETRNSRTLLAQTVLELYRVCERSVAVIESYKKPPVTNDHDLNKVNADIATIVKDQLEALLPQALKNALSPFQKQTQDNTAPNSLESVNKEPSTEPKHLLLVENKPENDEDRSELITEQQWTTVVKRKMKTQLKEIPVKKATLTQKGRATVVFPDEESLKKANVALSG